jgi:hypothetical protein
MNNFHYLGKIIYYVFIDSTEIKNIDIKKSNSFVPFLNKMYFEFKLKKYAHMSYLNYFI